MTILPQKLPDEWQKFGCEVIGDKIYMQAPWRETDAFASLDKDLKLEYLPSSFYGHSSGLQVYYDGTFADDKFLNYSEYKLFRKICYDRRL